MRPNAGLRKTRLERAGLERIWTVIVIVSWLMVTAALAAAAVTGRNIGKPTWWLGTASDPAWPLLWVVPFLAPIAVIVCAIVAGRWAPFTGIGASLYLGAVATLDLENTPAVALIQVVVACAAFLVSIASLAGRNR
jgi:hypothetical protein